MFRKRLIVGLALVASLAFSTASIAHQEISGTNTAVTKTEQVATPAPGAATTAPSQFDVKNPYEWVQLGKNAGLAMAEIAGQLGVAGDKVLDSNSGKIAVALVGAKLLGVTASDLMEVPYRLLSFVLGLVFIIVGVRIWTKSLLSPKDPQTNTLGAEKSFDDRTYERLERTIAGSAIIPITLFGFGLVFFNGFGIVFGALAALLLAFIKFCTIPEEGDAEKEKGNKRTVDGVGY